MLLLSLHSSHYHPTNAIFCHAEHLLSRGEEVIEPLYQAEGSLCTWDALFLIFDAKCYTIPWLKMKKWHTPYKEPLPKRSEIYMGSFAGGNFL